MSDQLLGSFIGKQLQDSIFYGTDVPPPKKNEVSTRWWNFVTKVNKLRSNKFLHICAVKQMTRPAVNFKHVRKPGQKLWSSSQFFGEQTLGQVTPVQTCKKWKKVPRAEIYQPNNFRIKQEHLFASDPCYVVFSTF